MIYIISFLTAIISFTAVFIGGNIIFELDSPPPIENAKFIEPRKKIGDVRLINSSNQKITAKAFTKHWSLISFGSTQCENSCASRLYQFNREIPLMDERSRNVHFAFITTDPEHDSPEKLRSYLSAINPAITGYTGTIDQITKFAKMLGIKNIRETQAEHPKHYYLVNPRGYLTAIYTPKGETGKLAVDLSRMIGNKINF